MPERSKANEPPPLREAQQEKCIPNCRRSSHGQVPHCVGGDDKKWEPLKELSVADHFAADRWREQSQTLCGGVHDDATEMQGERIKKCKAEGDRHFTEEGRIVEITVDLVFTARARMAEERVTWLEDSVVAETIMV